MQRINGRGAANRQWEDHFFLPAQWLLGIPFTILEDLRLFGKFVENCANRIGCNQRSRRRRRIATAKLHLDTVNTIQFINGGTSEQVGDARSTAHTQDGGYASRLDLGIYPDADGRAAFTLYEDDGVTRQYAEGRCAWQRFTAEPAGPGAVDVTIGPSEGGYAGQPERRSYRLVVHGGPTPAVVETPPVARAEWRTFTVRYS